MEEEEVYGIDIEHGHPRAIELIPDDFFWDCVDELAPFGSDEGDTALAEFRDWRKANPGKPVKDCLIWTIESVGQMKFEEYNTSLLDTDLIKRQLENDDDFFWFVTVLDISVIGTGFGQLADEGRIDPDAKPIIRIALDRQSLVNSLPFYDEETVEQHNKYIVRLKEILEKA